MLHVKESDLALFATGDLPAWQRLKVSIHVRQCDGCRTLVEAYRADAEFLKSGAEDLPSGVDWDRLSAEMTANIHLGLAAGECVAPPRKRREPVNVWEGFWGWRAAAAGVGMVVLVMCAWWMNMPPETNQAIKRVAQGLYERGPFGPPETDPGPVVEASSAGIEFRDARGGLGLAANADEPLAVTVSNTEASAQFMDDGQLVITTVYVP